MITKGHFIVIKQSSHQGNLTTITMYIRYINASKYMKIIEIEIDYCN